MNLTCFYVLAGLINLAVAFVFMYPMSHIVLGTLCILSGTLSLILAALNYSGKLIWDGSLT